MNRQTISRLIMSALAVILMTTAAGVQAGTLRDKLKERREERREARSGSSSSKSGLELVKFTHQGITRGYYIDMSTVAKGRPVVMLFHGGLGNGSKVADQSNMAALGRANGFAVVFPNSNDSQWNDGRNTTNKGVDDVDFVRTIARDLKSRYGLDTSRMFAAGISNGGIFSQRLACDAPDLFRAYGIVVAAMPTDFVSRCRPSSAQPMVFLIGTDDRLMPYNGGETGSSKALGMGAGGTVLSHAETRQFWLNANGCGSGSSRDVPDRVNDGTKVAFTHYSCRSGVSLDFYVIEGGGHNWPGSGGRESRLTGKVSREVSATSTLVAFFSRYGL